MSRENGVLAVLQLEVPDDLKVKAIREIFGRDYCGDFVRDDLNDEVSVREQDGAIFMEINSSRGSKICRIKKEVYTSIVVEWRDLAKRVD